MDIKQKEELLELFSQAFHEVVPPLIGDFKDEIGEKTDRVERKLDNVIDSQAVKLDMHERRIQNLEDKIVS